MAMFDSIRSMAFGVPAPEQRLDAATETHTTRPIPRKRKLDAGEVTRLTASWNAANLPADEEVKRSLERIRGRSRDLAYNNEYAKKYLQMVGTHIVGPSGFMLQSLVLSDKDRGQPDRLARDAIEQAFYLWAQRGVCEATGRMSFVELQRLVIETVARDGEALLLRRRGADNAFGYELKLLEIDRLPVSKNDTLKNGSTIVMGVELNTDGRAVAYWLNLGDLVSQSVATVTLTRVPAEDVIHLYRPGRAEQHRGLPWMHSVMTSLKMLAGYQESSLVAARVGAAKMGFYSSPDGTADPLADDQVEGEFMMDAEPGAISVLPPGYKFESWNPDYPHQNYESFVKATLRTVASGLGIAYHTLANDLAEVNYSSSRAGTIEERDNWIVLQNWLTEAMLRPIFNDWLTEALKRGAITMAMGSALPAIKQARFGVHQWQGRRWQWVDPMKDIEASVLAIKSGLASPQTIAAQQGLDLADVIDAIASANQLALDAGLPAYSAPEPVAPPAPEPPAPDNSLRDMAMSLLARSLETREAPAAPAINVYNQPPATTVNIEATRIDNHLPAPQIHNEISVQPADVQIAAPEIRNVIEVQPTDVTLEAQINIPPPDVRVQLPNRRTTGTIERDAQGNIVRTEQIERDDE